MSWLASTEGIIVPALDSVQQFNSCERNIQLRYYNNNLTQYL